MFFNSNIVKTLAVYTSDVHQPTFKTHSFPFQMLGKIVLDLKENSLLRHFAENTKSLSVNTYLKGALYFYIFMARKAFFNHILNYCFKIKINNFNSLFGFYVKVFTEHQSIFTETKLQIFKYMKPKKVFFFRANIFLTGVALATANELFQNIYKDIRPKTFCISAKFARVLILP